MRNVKPISKLMTGKEFAEKYIDRTVRWFRYRNPYYGRVVGYWINRKSANNDTEVLCELDDGHVKKPTYIDVVFLVNIDTIKRECQRLSPETLTVINSAFYEQRSCKVCKSPATRYGKIVICQNRKCKYNR